VETVSLIDSKCTPKFMNFMPATCERFASNTKEFNTIQIFARQDLISIECFSPAAALDVRRKLEQRYTLQLGILSLPDTVTVYVLNISNWRSIAEEIACIISRMGYNTYRVVGLGAAAKTVPSFEQDAVESVPHLNTFAASVGGRAEIDFLKGLITDTEMLRRYDRKLEINRRDGETASVLLQDMGELGLTLSVCSDLGDLRKWTKRHWFDNENSVAVAIVKPTEKSIFCAVVRCLSETFRNMGREESDFTISTEDMIEDTVNTEIKMSIPVSPSAMSFSRLTSDSRDFIFQAQQDFRPSDNRRLHVQLLCNRYVAVFVRESETGLQLNKTSFDSYSDIFDWVRSRQNDYPSVKAVVVYLGGTYCANPIGDALRWMSGSSVC
jgi:hypothetical protein